MDKAIIIGASSGIGRGLAKLLSQDNVFLGLAGRRTAMLDGLKAELPSDSIVKYMDVSDYKNATAQLEELIVEMGGVDLIIISAGTGFINKELDWGLELETIDTNVTGVTALICSSIHYFLKKKSGHLAVVSSIASLRGSSECPAYNASKSFLSNYLEGMQCKIKKACADIVITDIRPGLVDTAMAKGDGLFWVMPVEKTCGQIYKAIKAKRKSVYITKRWALVAFLRDRFKNCVKLRWDVE